MFVPSLRASAMLKDHPVHIGSPHQLVNIGMVSHTMYNDNPVNNVGTHGRKIIGICQLPVTLCTQRQHKVLLLLSCGWSIAIWTVLAFNTVWTVRAMYMVRP
jgi:hypothetical protein